jgi:hypothetical protein
MFRATYADDHEVETLVYLAYKRGAGPRHCHFTLTTLLDRETQLYELSSRDQMWSYCVMECLIVEFFLFAQHGARPIQSIECVLVQHSNVKDYQHRVNIVSRVGAASKLHPVVKAAKPKAERSQRSRVQFQNLFYKLNPIKIGSDVNRTHIAFRHSTAICIKCYHNICNHLYLYK